MISRPLDLNGVGEPLLRGDAIPVPRIHARSKTLDGCEITLTDQTVDCQDQEYFYLKRNGVRERIRYHDYATIYAIPGLYDWLFYDALQCRSHHTIAAALDAAIGSHDIAARPDELRVLELGAGNGITGSALRRLGVTDILGVDILDEAAAAAQRDHPGTYSEYLVTDLTAPSPHVTRTVENFHANLLVCVAALGFGDIPASAFAHAVNLVDDNAWVLFNIKDEFLGAGSDPSDKGPSDFAELIHATVEAGVLRVFNSENVLHRLTAAGQPINYTCITARKTPDWYGFVSARQLLG